MCASSPGASPYVMASVLGLLGALLIALPVDLQAKSASIKGIVFTLGPDRVQTVWSNARVTLKNIRTNSEISTVTNDLGEYQFTGVLYGEYQITVTLAN